MKAFQSVNLTLNIVDTYRPCSSVGFNTPGVNLAHYSAPACISAACTSIRVSCSNTSSPPCSISSGLHRPSKLLLHPSLWGVATSRNTTAYYRDPFLFELSSVTYGSSWVSLLDQVFNNRPIPGSLDKHFSFSLFLTVLVKGDGNRSTQLCA